MTASRPALPALLLLVAAALALAPGRIAFLTSRREVSRAADHLLQEADRRLPVEARIVVVTPGIEPRGSEYVAFHRAQYVLTPRPVWWITPAASDGTWQSRWWVQNVLTAESIGRFVREHRLTHALVLGGTLSFDFGTLMIEGQEGKLVGLEAAGDADLSRSSGFGRDAAVAPTILWLAVGLLMIVALGLGIRMGLTPHGRPSVGVELVADAWWIGSVCLTALMLWLDRAGLGPAAQRMALLGITAGALLAGLVRWGASRTAVAALPVTAEDTRRPVLLTAMLVLLACNISVVAVAAIGQPLQAWDSWVQWAAKARAIFRTGGIGAAVFDDPTRLNTHPAYPLLFPLREVWLFGLLGAPDDRWVGSLTLMDYLALLALAWRLMRDRQVPSVLACAAVTVVSGVLPLAASAGMALADVTVALLATAGVIHLLRWMEGRARANLVLGALAIGSLGWVKSEGVVLTTVVLVVLCGLPLSFREKGAAIAAVLAFFCVMTMPWWLIVPASGRVPVDFMPVTPMNLLSHTDRAAQIAFGIAGVLLDWPLGFVWPVTVGVFILHCMRTLPGRGDGRGIDVLPPLVALLYGAVVAGSFFFSTYVPLGLHIVNSYHRLAAQVTPLLVVWLGLRAGKESAS